MRACFAVVLTCCAYACLAQSNVSIHRNDANDSIKAVTPLTGWHLQTLDSIDRRITKMNAPVGYAHERRKRVPDWVFGFFIGQLLLVTFVRAQFAREFGEVFSVVVKNNLTQQLYRETQAVGLRMGYFLLNVNFVLSLGMWMFLMIKSRGIGGGYNDVSLIALLTGWVFALVALRVVAMRLAAWLLRSPKEVGLFGFTDLQLFRALGLLLFPVNAFLAYAHAPARFWFYGASLALLIGFVLFRCLRGFQIGRAHAAGNFFHFLVYICTLEIAPVLAGIRYLLNRFGY